MMTLVCDICAAEEKCMILLKTLLPHYLTLFSHETWNVCWQLNIKQSGMSFIE